MPKKSSKRDDLKLSLNASDGKKFGAVTKQPGKGVPLQSPGSPVGDDLVGLRYIDDVGSRENLLGPGLQEGQPPSDPVAMNKGDPVRNGPQANRDSQPDPLPVNEVVDEPQDATETQALIPPVTTQPVATTVCPPGLECMLEEGQLVVHMGRLRQDLTINEDATRRMEVIDSTKRLMFHVEEDETLREDSDTDRSFHFRLYNHDKVEVMQVYSPHNTSCVCCGATWHCLKRCKFQAIVYSPPGVVVGFVKRSQTRFVQEYQILNAQEKPMLTLRGGAQDLEIYSLDLDNELGRMSVHGWHGVMHEIRRTNNDWGLTFPLDLDVQVKATLLGAVFAIDWVIRTKGGKKKSQPEQAKASKDAKKKEKPEKGSSKPEKKDGKGEKEGLIKSDSPKKKDKSKPPKEDKKKEKKDKAKGKESPEAEKKSDKKEDAPESAEPGLVVHVKTDDAQNTSKDTPELEEKAPEAEEELVQKAEAQSQELEEIPTVVITQEPDNEPEPLEDKAEPAEIKDSATDDPLKDGEAEQQPVEPEQEIIQATESTPVECVAVESMESAPVETAPVEDSPASAEGEVSEMKPEEASEQNEGDNKDEDAAEAAGDELQQVAEADDDMEDLVEATDEHTDEVKETTDEDKTAKDKKSEEETTADENSKEGVQKEEEKATN